MEKIIKSNLFGFIIGIIIMSGIGVYATNYLYQSDNVTYNDKSVKGALDELYNNVQNFKSITPFSSKKSSYGLYPGSFVHEYVHVTDYTTLNLTLYCNWNGCATAKVYNNDNNQLIGSTSATSKTYNIDISDINDIRIDITATTQSYGGTMSFEYSVE